MFWSSVSIAHNVIVFYSSSPQNPAVKVVKWLEMKDREKKIRLGMMNKTQLTVAALLWAFFCRHSVFFSQSRTQAG